MGRYYNGDIEGKFWFAVQDSNDADFFGVTGEEPNYLYYYFDKDNLPSIEEGINTCIKELGEYKEKLDRFFEKNPAYNDEMVSKELSISSEKVKEMLVWYARLKLGQKILDCVKTTGSCSFEAEL